MAFADFDSSRWPLVVVSFTGELPDDVNFESYLYELDRVYDRKEKFVFIFCALNARFPATKYQNLQAEWMRKNKILFKPIANPPSM